MGGSTEAEGRVEYCYNGQWAPSCVMTQQLGKLICEKLGYQTEREWEIFSVMHTPLYSLN